MLPGGTQKLISGAPAFGTPASMVPNENNVKLTGNLPRYYVYASIR